MKAETRIADKEGRLEGWTPDCRHQYTSTLNLVLIATMANHHYIDNNILINNLTRRAMEPEMPGVSAPTWIDMSN